MKIGNCVFNPAFDGKARIFAITDSHQETRKTCALLSEVLRKSKNQKDVLFLNCGDIYKGIYPASLEKDSYIKMKEAKPDMEMVFTIGNNDLGFNQQSIDFLINTVKDFAKKNIHTVCANIFEASGKRPNWLKPYTIIERDGDKNFITGFCINNIHTQKFGIEAKPIEKTIDEIKNAILKEKPDNVILLNHDFRKSSQKAVKIFKENGINIDLTIGGHDHRTVYKDSKHNIFYPKAFSDTMYSMDLINDNGNTSVSNIRVIQNKRPSLSPIFEKDILEYEKETHLHDPIVKRILDLKMNYMYPSSFGTFMADSMKEFGNADIAFFSTGFISHSLEYKPNSFITKYILKRAMPTVEPVKLAELTADDLKKVFSHALKRYGKGNTQFLQCSSNIRLAGENNPITKIFDVKQIYINNIPLLDSSGKAINPDKKYRCIIDHFIARGGQGYDMLDQLPKTEVIENGKVLYINEALINGLKEAPSKYKEGTQYPTFQIDVLK